jgi:hypothetical protein
MRSSGQAAAHAAAEGAVLKMDPLGKLQVAVKNNIDVLYFTCFVPYNVLFTEDGALGTMLTLRARARVCVCVCVCVSVCCSSLIFVAVDPPTRTDKSDYLRLWKEVGEATESTQPIT